MIPLVIACYGKQKYLPIVLHHAEKHNAHSVIIGDQQTRALGAEHFLFTDYNDGDFSRTYEHMGHGGHRFHLFCFERWFAIRNYMREHSVEKAFVCDADVMIYCDLEQEEEKFGDYLAVYSVPENQPGYRWSAGGIVSYWTLAGLESFCDFMFQAYTSAEGLAELRKKWQWHQESGWHGGVCDMTLLYLFSKEHHVEGICQVRDHTAFDHNINVSENYHPDEYMMTAGGVKTLKWQDNQPYAYNLVLNDWVRFNSLHFQGGAKRLIREFAR